MVGGGVGVGRFFLQAEDGIRDLVRSRGLGDVYKRQAQVDAALTAYEAERRDQVGRIQHSANVSLVWFENVRRFWHMSPTQFHVSLLTRSKQITYENLRLRDAEAVSYTHLRAHETVLDLVCRLLLEKKTNHGTQHTHIYNTIHIHRVHRTLQHTIVTQTISI